MLCLRESSHKASAAYKLLNALPAQRLNEMTAVNFHDFQDFNRLSNRTLFKKS
jgi:hypothetical protein